MTIINITLPFGLIKDIHDYSEVVNEILKHEISFNILKFSTSSSGITMLLDIPDDKIEEITESLKKNSIIVNKKGRVILDQEKCIDCGACISLCPTDALSTDREDKLVFSEEKCMGCGLCINACPRQAIVENF